MFGAPRSVIASIRPQISTLAATVPPASFTSAAQRLNVSPVYGGLHRKAWV
jgi:hypothetical protein